MRALRLWRLAWGGPVGASWLRGAGREGAVSARSIAETIAIVLWSTSGEAARQEEGAMSEAGAKGAPRASARKGRHSAHVPDDFCEADRATRPPILILFGILTIVKILATPLA
eukprot:scaffold101442_cov30-Tisochrysis_lutea.AAC.3